MEFRVKHLSREISGMNLMPVISLISCIKWSASRLHVRDKHYWMCISCCKTFKNPGRVFPGRAGLVFRLHPIIWLTPFTIPNGIRIHLAILPQYTFRQTHTHRPTDGLGDRSVRWALMLAILMLCAIDRSLCAFDGSTDSTWLNLALFFRMPLQFFITGPFVYLPYF